jgi:transposase
VEHDTRDSLGGVSRLRTERATLSTGEKIPNPKRYHARLKYLRQQQRCLARRQKGSRRREKQRLRVDAGDACREEEILVQVLAEGCGMAMSRVQAKECPGSC